MSKTSLLDRLREVEKEHRALGAAVGYSVISDRRYAEQFAEVSYKLRVLLPTIISLLEEAEKMISKDQQAYFLTENNHTKWLKKLRGEK